MANQNMLDLTDLQSDLEEAARTANLTVHQVILGFAYQIQADAQQRAHVITGKMRANIAVTEPSPGEIVIGVDDNVVPYAKYEEYGTQPHVIRAKNKKALAFKMGGKTVIVKSVHHPGQPAHPYMRPAAQDFLDQLGSEAAEVGVTLLGNNR